jgi:hypothetical protein
MILFKSGFFEIKTIQTIFSIVLKVYLKSHLLTFSKLYIIYLNLTSKSGFFEIKTIQTIFSIVLKYT